jgi:hypothetical protein
MSHSAVRSTLVTALAVTALSFVGLATPQGAPSPEQRVAALKQSIQESQAQLRKYEWIQTTIVSLKGDEKNRKQERCYYGADGTVQKVLLDDQSAAPPQGGRLKQRIVANKKEDMKEYMDAAVSLIEQYVPPKPADIDSAKTRQTIAIRPGQGGRVRVAFTDYIKPGDQLAVDVDGAANRVLGVSVNTYLDTAQDAVTLAVGFRTLPDGTSYAAQTTLTAPAKNITVVVQNSGHRPVER